MALVLSHTIASTPSSPSAAKAASSVGGPTSGVGSSFQSPVCSTMPAGVRIASACASGIECADAQELQLERRQVEGAAGRDDVDLHLVQQLRLAQLAAQHGGGERRRVDRAAQLAPQPGDGAEMVLVRVGDDQADQLVAPLGDEGRDRAS